jgi:hypothetical protein
MVETGNLQNKKVRGEVQEKEDAPHAKMKGKIHINY